MPPYHILDIIRTTLTSFPETRGNNEEQSEMPEGWPQVSGGRAGIGEGC